MNLNDLKCCMPNRPQHFVQSQKILSCGHPVCSNCIETDCPIGIKCARCNKTNSSDLSSSFDYINKLSEKYIESNLVEFSQFLYCELKNTINDIELNVSNADEKINTQFERIENEIECKINVLKNKLEKIGQDFKHKLGETKNQVKSFLFDSIDLASIEERLYSYREDVERNSFSVDNFYFNNMNLLDFGQTLQDLKKFDLNVKFVDNSNFEITQDSIGSIDCSYFDFLNKIEEIKSQTAINQDHYQSVPTIKSNRKRKLSYISQSGSSSNTFASTNTITSSDDDDSLTQPRKVSRDRRHWSDDECCFLVFGVKSIGLDYGDWPRILSAYKSRFNERRSVDLRQKYHQLKNTDKIKFFEDFVDNYSDQIYELFSKNQCFGSVVETILKSIR